MRRFRYLLLLAFLLRLDARADHAAGGELTYRWIRDSTYEFSFRLFRDCTGQIAPLYPVLCYYNSCNTGNGSTSMRREPLLPDGRPNGSEVTTGCPNVSTRCADPASVIPGYEEWLYRATVTLSSRCDYWTFSVATNDRNASNNIPAMTGTRWNNLYIEATLNNRDVQGQSSPYFTVSPLPYICINSPYSYNGVAADPDGDSLSFEFIAPRTQIAGGCPVSYSAGDISLQPGYNLVNNPFATGNTFSFDPRTGGMRFTPALLGAGVVAVRVNKYRNGVKTGSVMRDMQFQVLSCNTPPVTFDMDVTSVQGAKWINGNIVACSGDSIRFCYRASGAGTLLAVSDNHVSSMPDAAVMYNNQGTGMVTGCFSWRPGARDTGMRLLAVKVKDTSCSPPGIMVTQTFTIPVYVYPSLSTERDVRICAGSPVTITASGNGGPVSWKALPGGDPTGSLSCTGCLSPVADPSRDTRYVAVAALSNGCYSTDTVSVYVDNANSVKITPPGPVISCRPDRIMLEARASGPKPLAGVFCGPAGPGIPPTPEDTAVILPPPVPLKNTANPAGTPFGGAASEKRQYLLRAADMKASGMHAGSLKGLSFRFLGSRGSTVFRDVSIALKCLDADSLPATGFIAGAVPVYHAAMVTVPAGGGYVNFDFNTLYNWDAAQNLLIEVCYAGSAGTPAYTASYGTAYSSTLFSTGSDCRSGAGAAPPAYRELPLIRLQYYRAPEADFTYRWTNSVFQPSANVPDPSTYITGSKTLYVETRGLNGCTVRDSIDVYMPQFAFTASDTVICLGNSIQLEAANGIAWTWYEDGFMPAASLSCSNCPAPVARPAADITYAVAVTDSYGCTDTLYRFIRVIPQLEVRILNKDTTLKYGQSLQLHATGADTYYWMPPDGLDDTQRPDPVASPRQPVEYVVAGRADGAGTCPGYDTIRINIDYRDRIFFPSAFTPDGDGRNDVFRIVNHSFQEILEFRVFNRWGQDVFHAADNRGWDGNWKGVPQETGVYHYIIRVGYPDGYKEMFKGDVTLVR